MGRRPPQSSAAPQGVVTDQSLETALGKKNRHQDAAYPKRVDEGVHVGRSSDKIDMKGGISPLIIGMQRKWKVGPHADLPSLFHGMSKKGGICGI